MSRCFPSPTGPIAGTITQAADLATQVYHGDASGLVTGTAQFTLSGSLGSVAVSLTEGETLAGVAQRVNDQTGTTGVAARVEGTDLYLESTATGTSARVSVTGVDREESVSVTGVNAAQAAAFDALSLPEGTTVVLTGDITQSADYARQSYTGTAGTVVDDATFTVEGSLGSQQFSITQGESLIDVAQRINDATATTGVSATASGDELAFENSELGSAASLRVTLDSLRHYQSVDGVNASQVTNFQVLAHQEGAVNTLVGSVDSAATRGQLTYTGLLGTANTTATFTLTGASGSADFSVGTFTTLSSLAGQINSESATTGVSAEASGSTLTLTSVGYGSGAIVEVDVSSGSFDTDGGDGQGAAAGANALLTLNGQSVTSDGLDVSYSDAVGAYDLTLAAGFAGTLDDITVTSTAGDFTVTGGDGSGFSYGVDATASLNGNALTAAGDQFAATIDGLSFTLQSAAGFTGVIGAITVESVAAVFDVSGGDASGDAFGADTQATLNGQAFSSSDVRLAVSLDGVSLRLDLVAGFAGSLDPITVSSTAHDFTLTGGDGQGAAAGVDGQATVNGQALTSTGNDFLVPNAEGDVRLSFQPGFLGAFDAVTVRQAVDGSVETRRFASSPPPTAPVTFGGRPLQRDGDFVLLEQDGVQVALRIADGFSGQLEKFSIRAAGEPVIPATQKPYTGGSLNRVRAAVRDLIASGASGGTGALIGANPFQTLESAVKALADLRTVTYGDATVARRSLVGDFLDRLV